MNINSDIDVYTIDIIPQGYPLFNPSSSPMDPNSVDGDLVLIIQMTNDDNALSISSEKMEFTIGKYCIARITQEVADNTYHIFVPTSVTPNFQFPGKVQIIKIPEFYDLELINGAFMTCHEYDPATGTGGVVCFTVKNNFVIENGVVSASGKGFPAGEYYGDNFGIGGYIENGAIHFDPNTPLAPYTWAGFSQNNLNHGYGLNGNSSTANGKSAFSPIYLMDDPGKTCNLTLMSANYDPGDGGANIQGQAGVPGKIATQFPETSFSFGFTSSTGPIYMGNSGKGGASGHGGGAAGNGGGASAANISYGGSGSEGTDGLEGAEGGDGGTGGGIVMIRAANIDITTYNSSFKYIRSTGDAGERGKDGWDIYNLKPGFIPGYGGIPGIGGNGIKGDRINLEVYLPGRGGASGQPGQGPGGGSGGNGGNGGSVFVVYANSGTNILTNDNIDVGSGHGGFYGLGGQNIDGFDGTDGIFDDLTNDDCYYLQYSTFQEDCQCEEIFTTRILNSINNYPSSWITTATGYEFRTTDGWTCEYKPDGFNPACINGRRLHCYKTDLVDDGTQGKEAPMQQLKTIKICDMKSEPYNNDLDVIWDRLFSEVYGGFASATVVGGSIFISGNSYNFEYGSKVLTSASKEATSCCQPASGGGVDDDPLWGEKGVLGTNIPSGNSFITTDEPKVFIVFNDLNESSTSDDDLNFELFPNPSTEMISLKCNSMIDRAFSFCLTDYSGKNIYCDERKIIKSGLTIDFNLEELPAATYLIRISDLEKNEIVKQIKFIKQ